MDVAAHMGLLEEMATGQVLPSRGRDFVGLLVADLIPALALVLIGLVAAAISRRWLGGHSWEREFVVCVSAATVALVVLAGVRLTWGLHAFQPVGLLLAVAAGGATWIALRGRYGDRPDRAWTLTEIVGCVTPPSLLVAFASRAASFAGGGEWGRAVIDIIAVLAAGGLLLVNRRGSRPRLSWAALVLTVLLAVRVVVLSSWPGRSSEHAGSAATSGRPNIVLIVLDTVRADHLKRYGYDRDTMPSLERWGEGATVARRALSSAGWTSPAHASIFSGLPVSLHGIHFASGRTEALSTPPVEGLGWLPQRLAELGYFRLAVSANPRAVPDASGFSRVIAPVRYGWQLSTIGSLFDRQSSALERLNSRIRWQTPYTDAEEITDLVEAATPLGEGPIFLFVNYMDAHSPYNPPQAALDRLDLEPGDSIHRYDLHRELTKRWDRLPSGREDDLRDLYDGELNGLDLQLGRLLQWIDRRLGSDTTVIVTSDHGEELGEEGRVGHEYGLAQRLIHVPLFIRTSDLPSGDLDEVVDTRRLFDFILAAASGTASRENLLRDDGFGHLAERYPTEHNVRSIGPGYDRVWVSLIEDGFKAVGPTSHGLELMTLDSEDFSRESAASPEDAGPALGQRIDSYWSSHQDRREESTDSQAPSEEEIRMLRSLGYVP